MTMNQLSYKVAERALDLRVPGHAAEARAVRRAGGPDVLPVARRRDRAVRRSSARSSGCRASRAAGDRGQQDRQHDHRPRRPRRSCRSSRRSSSRTTSRAPRSSSTSRSSKSIATRAKTYGLNLSEYALGAHLLAGSRRRAARRPRRRPARPARPAAPARRPRRPARRRRRAACSSPPPFNLNTISRGVSTADFYLAVPTAIVRFLESDTQTKLSPSRSCAARKAPS